MCVFLKILHGDIFISFSDVLVVYKRNILIVSVMFFFDGIQVHVTVCLLSTDQCKAFGNKFTVELISKSDFCCHCY